MNYSDLLEKDLSTATKIISSLLIENKRYQETLQTVLDYEHVEMTVPSDVIKMIEEELES